MLEGIEIISQTPIMQTPDLVVSIQSVCMLAGCIGIVLFIIGILIKSDLAPYVGLYMVGLGLVIHLVMASLGIQEPTGRYEYKITVDKSVIISDLYKNYDIVGQDGENWIIRDKDREDTYE